MTSAIASRAFDVAARLRSGFLPYFLVSLAALGADLAVFATLTEATPLRAGLAAMLAWWIGLALHYHLARAVLYRDMPRGGRLRARVARFLTYAGPSIAGLGLTVVVVEIGVMLGFAPVPVKAVAAVASFGLAFVMRSLMFSGPKLAAV